MARRYREMTLYDLLAAYADVRRREGERQRRDELYPFKLPPMTIGGARG